MSNLKNIIVTVLVAAVVALGIGAVARPSLPAGILVDAGASAQTFGATAASLSSVVFSHLTNLQVNQNFGVVGTFFGGGVSTAPNFQTNWSVGSCNTATSTLFAVTPPSGATSTITQFVINGIVAQISDIAIGTSTLTSVTSTSSLNVAGAGGLMGAAAVPVGSFYAVSGIKTVGPKGGYTTNGNGPYNSVSEMVVGPTENLVGFATSTAVTGGQGVTSCTYKIEWQN